MALFWPVLFQQVTCDVFSWEIHWKSIENLIIGICSTQCVHNCLLAITFIERLWVGKKKDCKLNIDDMSYFGSQLPSVQELLSSIFCLYDHVYQFA